MAETPKPWDATHKMPGCFEEVSQKVTMVWEGVWQPKNHTIEFYCDIGKRDVSLTPNFNRKLDFSNGCDGCPAYTPQT